MNSQHDIWPCYAAADFCVFPTLGDAFGMVPLEAMAAGLPVILSDARTCGFARHVSSGTNALVLPDPHDASALAEAVGRLLTEPALATQLRHGGFALASEFSWPVLAQAMAAEYGRVAQARQGLVSARVAR